MKDREHEGLARALATENHTLAIALLRQIARDRPLNAREAVILGRLMLISESADHSPEDSLELFERALVEDERYVPAMLECGWFHYSVANDAQTAKPYFTRAIDEIKQQLSDAVEGVINCERELEGEIAADASLRRVRDELLDVDAIRAELIPIVTED